MDEGIYIAQIVAQTGLILSSISMKVCELNNYSFHLYNNNNNNNDDDDDDDNNFIEVSKFLVLWTNWGHKSK